MAEFSLTVLPAKNLYAKQMLDVSSQIPQDPEIEQDNTQNEDGVSNTKRGLPK